MFRRDGSNRGSWGLVLVLSGACAGCGVDQDLGDRPTGDAATDGPLSEGAAGPDGASADAGDGEGGPVSTIDGGDGGGAPAAEGGSTVDGGAVTPAACAVACEDAAVTGCNVDSTTADNECVTFCARSPTSAQLACLASTPCAALTSALASDGSICGIPAQNTLGCYTYDNDNGCTCSYDTPPPEPADTTECSVSSLVADAQPGATCCADIGYRMVAGTSCICSSAALGVVCSSGQTMVSSCTM
jgi:hypothetical protein